MPSQLPPSWPTSLPRLEYLSMSRCGLVGTLPPEWGLAGAFPSLEQLWLSNNSQLTGQPPEQEAHTKACMASMGLDPACPLALCVG